MFSIQIRGARIGRLMALVTGHKYQYLALTCLLLVGRFRPPHANSLVCGDWICCSCVYFDSCHHLLTMNCLNSREQYHHQRRRAKICSACRTPPPRCSVLSTRLSRLPPLNHSRVVNTASITPSNSRPLRTKSFRLIASTLLAATPANPDPNQDQALRRTKNRHRQAANTKVLG